MDTIEVPELVTVDVSLPNGTSLGKFAVPFRTFATGSKGYGFSGKLGAGIVSDKGLQASINLVLIGTKPKD